jgi:hypothetical protein
MPSADLYRRHAATCRRLAHDHCDKEWTSSLISLAYEYEAKAAAKEVASRSTPGAPRSPDDPPDGESSEYVEG